MPPSVRNGDATRLPLEILQQPLDRAGARLADPAHPWPMTNASAIDGNSAGNWQEFFWRGLRSAQ